MPNADEPNQGIPQSRNNFCCKNLVGEIGFVTKEIGMRKNGFVRISGREYPASYQEGIRKGRWIRVVSDRSEILVVQPINIWLGSCCI